MRREGMGSGHPAHEQAYSPFIAPAGQRLVGDRNRGRVGEEKPVEKTTNRVGERILSATTHRA